MERSLITLTSHQKEKLGDILSELYEYRKRIVLQGSAGVGKTTFYGVLLSCAASMLPLLAPNYYVLMGALFLFGAANGITDISMNTLVTEIEKKESQYRE